MSPYLSQAVPGVNLVHISDVVFACGNGEQACVGVVELFKKKSH